MGKFDWDELCVILAQFHREVGTRTDLRERTVQGITVTGFDGVLDAEDVPAAWRTQCTVHLKLCGQGLARDAVSPGGREDCGVPHGEVRAKERC